MRRASGDVLCLFIFTGALGKRGLSGFFFSLGNLVPWVWLLMGEYFYDLIIKSGCISARLIYIFLFTYSL